MIKKKPETKTERKVRLEKLADEYLELYPGNEIAASLACALRRMADA